MKQILAVALMSLASTTSPLEVSTAKVEILTLITANNHLKNSEELAVYCQQIFAATQTVAQVCAKATKEHKFAGSVAAEHIEEWKAYDRDSTDAFMVRYKQSGVTFAALQDLKQQAGV